MLVEAGGQATASLLAEGGRGRALRLGLTSVCLSKPFVGMEVAVQPDQAGPLAPLTADPADQLAPDDDRTLTRRTPSPRERRSPRLTPSFRAVLTKPVVCPHFMYQVL